MAKLTVADIPHMLKMWDQELNTENPEQVSANCSDPKYWKCPVCGYDWSASPKARYKGSGKCPCHESNKVICKGVNDVFTLVTGIAAYIDENNNFDEIYTQGIDSTLPVNFKCDECGRRWTATLKSQIKKDGNGGYIASGCPHYNTSKRKKSDVPFCSEVESIIKFWDDKNLLDPTTTRSNSTNKAHFVCKNCGYDWTTEIRTQGRASEKCKCCERHLILRKGFSDVFTLIPDSKRFFDFNKNKDIDIYSIHLRDSKTQIDWKCPDCGYEWKASLADRIKGKKGNYRFVGCHNCYLHSKERITPAALNPKILKYWDYKKNEERGLDINLVSANAKILAAWKCKECGYEWESNIKSRTDSNGKCPFCESNFKPVRKNINDVLTLCPKLKEIYDFDYNAQKGIDIYKEGVHSRKIVHFKCKKCGHEWDSQICSRVKKTTENTYALADCPKCSNGNHRQIPYSVEFPILAQMYRNDLNPIPLDSITGRKALCKTPYYWKCLICGETFESTLESMIGSQKYQTKGCPFCSRNRLRKGESFAEVYPEYVKYWADSNRQKAEEVYYNSTKRFRFICPICKVEHSAYISDFLSGNSCAYCKGTRLSPKTNSLKALYPDIARRWSPSNDIGPDKVLPTSNLWTKWICDTCKGEYGSFVKEVVNGKDECPYCNDRLVKPGFNSFADKHPDLLEEMDEVANYLLPKSPYEVLDTSKYKFWFTCKNNPEHKYLMSPRTRLMFQKREREPCLYCRGYRRKLKRFTSYNKKP